MSTLANLYLSKMIRAGVEKEDVDMFAALCQQCKTDVGQSRHFMFLLLDMARHNKCDVLDIVKTGRVCSSQKNINQAFVDAILMAVASDDERDASTGVLDLTAEEELSESGSGSYEETDSYYNDNPNSYEAYEIDGFVVPDHHSDPDADVDNGRCAHGMLKSERDESGCEPCGVEQFKRLDKKKRVLKRRVNLVSQE